MVIVLFHKRFFSITVLNDEVSLVQNVVKDLEKESLEISEVLNVIDTIAEQTNLGNYILVYTR